eukprot:4642950-Pleurochrysis_carterae.AAC.1
MLWKVTERWAWLSAAAFAAIVQSLPCVWRCKCLLMAFRGLCTAIDAFKDLRAEPQRARGLRPRGQGGDKAAAGKKGGG